MKVRFINSSISDFLGKLDEQSQVRTAKTIALLRELGSEVRSPHSRAMGDGLFELRVQGRSAIRLMYAFHKEEAIILHGFIKKKQKTPKRELDLAVRILRDLRHT